MKRRSRRFWSILGAAVLVALGVTLVALPELLRLLAVRQLAAATGRTTSIADVDLNLFTGRLMVERLAVGEGDDRLARFARLEARLRVLPLLAGRLEIAEGTLTGPDIRIVRGPTSRAAEASAAGLPIHLVVDRFEVAGGRLTFEDRRLAPPATWTAEGLSLALHDLTTRDPDRPGRATASFTLSGAAIAVDVEPLHLVPPRARAVLRVDGLPIEPYLVYLPADMWARPDRGRLVATLTAEYGEKGGARADLDATLHDLVVRRRDQADPLVSAPAVAVTVRDLALHDDRVALGRAELSAEPTVLDGSTSPPQRFVLRELRLAVTDAASRAEQPAVVDLTAVLAEGDRLDVHGTVDLGARAADLKVALAGVDLARVRPYLPRDAVVALGTGHLVAALSVQHATDSGTRLAGSGSVAAGSVVRRGQATPFVSVPRLAFSLAELALHQGRIAAVRVEISGNPTIVDESVSPAARFTLPAVRIAAEQLALPSGPPARVELDASLPDGGHVRARGTVEPGPLAADVTLSLDDVDLRLLRPYLGPTPAIEPERGRLGGTLAVRRDATGRLGLDGTLALEPLALARPGQPPFVELPRLAIALREVAVDGGAVSAAGIELDGSATVVDRRLSPPQQYELSALRLALTDVAWPAGRPAPVELDVALTGGDRLTARGTVEPATLAADLRLGLDAIDLVRLDPYVPPDVPVRLREGRLRGALALRRDAGGALHAGGDLTLEPLALESAAQLGLVVAAPRLTIALRDLTLDRGAFTAARVEIQGQPTLVDAAASPPRRLAMESLLLAVEDAAWPAPAPARVEVSVGLPEAGTLGVAGTVDAATRRAALHVAARALALEAFRSYLPIQGRLDARLDADLDVVAGFGSEPGVSARGVAKLAGVELGPRERPALRIESAEADGIDVAWPERVAAERLRIRKPSAQIERSAQGTFFLRELLARRPADGAGASTTAVVPVPPVPPREPEPPHKLAIRIGEVAIEDGYARFIDRTTTPSYSEEISRLALTLEKLDSASADPARIAVQGVVGGGALELHGEVAPFGEPFFLDVAGEIRDFSVARVNPYARKALAWVARTGRLTTTVRYRILGERLEAENEILVERLDVARAGEGNAIEQVLGVSLGLAVALLKNQQGVIRLSVPVSGELGAPGFNVGHAIATALQNVVVKTLTAPLALIGKVLRKGDRIEAIRIEPVHFEPGSAAVTPPIDRDLQRVADFLRASPFVSLVLASTVGEADLASLKAQEVTATIQRAQREQRLDGFPAAAAYVFRSRLPQRPVPAEAEAILAALRDAEPVPEEAARTLAARRLEATRETLITAAGIEPDRLRLSDAAPAIGAAGEGRIEFEIQPAK